MGTEPAVTVINYLWNRLGEEAGADGEAGNTEMETERFLLVPCACLDPRL